MIAEYSVLPNTFKDKDPRNLLYFTPSLPVVRFAKLYQEFAHYKQLQLAESMARKFDCILVPLECMNWRRAKQFGHDKKVKVGRNSYFMMHPSELTRNEKRKLEEYIQELNYSS
ncbi:hypothetical protein COF76_27535 [Bacillus wiedmannii]|uniref:hypothetical protein n=1 Tax=Bacillus wiedmannii TaxID=1890302 RepID=UPI000BF935B1|nr:hypothetical protein [Bacillus wiedmannii]PFZ53522.1 hypothetical protein COL68_23670 [Bacillus wiedmannii]PHE92441.1 hypothetical protein COF76_27535 [Bacillus wiedmannii]